MCCFCYYVFFFCVGDARIYESSGFVDFTDHVYLYSESTNLRCIKLVLTVDFIALAVFMHIRRKHHRSKQKIHFYKLKAGNDNCMPVATQREDTPRSIKTLNKIKTSFSSSRKKDGALFKV